MARDVYVELQRHLDTCVYSAPKSSDILEILRIRFTAEEAEIALLLGQVPADVPTLANASGMNEHGLRSILEKMSDKTLVNKQKKKKDGVVRDVYSLLPTPVGPSVT